MLVVSFRVENKGRIAYPIKDEEWSDEKEVICSIFCVVWVLLCFILMGMFIFLLCKTKDPEIRMLSSDERL